MFQFLMALLLCVASLMCVPALASPSPQEPAGPPAPSEPRYTDVSAGLSGLSDAQILKVAHMQTVGYALLGAGFGTALAGIILIEAFEFGPGAMAGFITSGTGIATLITGMFLLGFSRPVHGYASHARLRLSSSGVAGANGIGIRSSF